jgi:hypothetical protein
LKFEIKVVAAWMVLSVSPVVLAGQSAAAAHNALARQYREGEKLAYKMNGQNEAWKYTIQNDGLVKKDASGVFTEEYTWSGLETAGQKMPLSAQTADFRQRVTLDPSRNPNVPDLTKVDPKIIGPITDFMTFYADVWLAVKLGQLHKAGDHFYFSYPVPSSWADGTYVILGQTAIDFDMTWKSTNEADKTALIQVLHVPPAKVAVTLPAPWMQVPVGDAPNNWVTVQKTQDGKFSAGVGKETFDVEIVVSLVDGKILSGKLDNLVKTVERVCEDKELTKCGDAKPHDIVRKVDIALIQ